MLLTPESELNGVEPASLVEKALREVEQPAMTRQ
jgi:DNA-binding protein Fis